MGSDQSSAEAARVPATGPDRQAGSGKAGTRGDRGVALALDGLAPWGRVLHDRLLTPGSTPTNLDHVVICPAGLFLVGTRSATTAATDPELDQLHRMAARTERVLGMPVEPVLCLAADADARCAPQRVRGVGVVPVGRIAQWLADQPVSLLPGDVDRFTAAASLAFPPAPGPAARTRLPEPPGSWGGLPFGAGLRHHRRPPDPAASAPPSATGRRNPGRTFVRAVAVSLLMVFGLQLLAWELGRPVGLATLVPPAARALAGSAPGTPRPCTALTGPAIAAILGHPVFPQVATSYDDCGWYLTPPGQGFVLPDISVTTGYAAHARTLPLKAALVSAAGGVAEVLVPQFATVPGSPVPTGNVTQPIVITYRYPAPLIPVSATPAAASQAEGAAATRAAAVVTALAGDLAAHLPQGDDATDVTLHPFS